MKALIAFAGAVATIATVAHAQQAPRPQVQKVAPAGTSAAEESMSARGTPAPLSGQKRLQVYGTALATPKPLQSGELGEAARLTPRNLYVNATTFANVFHSTIAPAEGPTGVSNIFPMESGNPPKLEIHFRAAANKPYIVDCTIIGAGGTINARGPSGSLGATLVDGHLVAAVPAFREARAVEVELSSQRSFRWTSCDIVPVNR
ncbi:MAG TPA: hypothetical protein VF876_07655 [Burkholderiales bacterium]